MMKRNRGETMQQQKIQEETPAKSQRRYKSPKRPHNNAPKNRTEDNNPTTAPADPVIDSICTGSSEMYTEDPIYAVWDELELSGVWPWAVEQEELSGWYPFVEGHFREIGEEEGIDLLDLWRLNDIIEVPN